MKKLIAAVVLTFCAAVSSCHTIGSVSTEAVQEMLESPGLAVTPFQPVWLDADGRNVWPLTETDRQAVCDILRAGSGRDVPELAYQTDDEHAPLVQNRFYIYATNGQCLAATVLNDRVVMHDVVLPEEQERTLFRILRPYLKKVFTGLS